MDTQSAKSSLERPILRRRLDAALCRNGESGVRVNSLFGVSLWGNQVAFGHLAAASIFYA